MDGDFLKFMGFAFALTIFLAVFAYSIFVLALFPLSPEDTLRFVTLAYTSSMVTVAVIFALMWELAKIREQAEE